MSNSFSLNKLLDGTNKTFQEIMDAGSDEIEKIQSEFIGRVNSRAKQKRVKKANHETWTETQQYRVIALMLSGTPKRAKDFFQNFLKREDYPELQEMLKRFVLETLAENPAVADKNEVVKKESNAETAQTEIAKASARKVFVAQLRKIEVDDQGKRKGPGLGESIIDSSLNAELAGAHLARLGELSEWAAKRILVVGTGFFHSIANFFRWLFRWPQHPSRRLDGDGLFRIQKSKFGTNALSDYVLSVTTNNPWFAPAYWDMTKPHLLRLCSENKPEQNDKLFAHAHVWQECERQVKDAIEGVNVDVLGLVWRTAGTFEKLTPDAQGELLDCLKSDLLRVCGENYGDQNDKLFTYPRVWQEYENQVRGAIENVNIEALELILGTRSAYKKLTAYFRKRVLDFVRSLKVSAAEFSDKKQSSSEHAGKLIKFFTNPVIVEKILFDRERSARISGDELCDLICVVDDGAFQDSIANNPALSAVLEDACYEKLCLARDKANKEGSLFSRLNSLIVNHNGCLSKRPIDRLAHMVVMNDAKGPFYDQLPSRFFDINSGDSGQKITMEAWVLDILDGEEGEQKESVFKQLKLLMEGDAYRMLEFWARFPKIWSHSDVQEKYALEISSVLPKKVFASDEVYAYRFPENSRLVKEVKKTILDSECGHVFSKKAYKATLKELKRAGAVLGMGDGARFSPGMELNQKLMALKKAGVSFEALEYGLVNFGDVTIYAAASSLFYVESIISGRFTSDLSLAGPTYDFWRVEAGGVLVHECLRRCTHYFEAVFGEAEEFKSIQAHFASFLFKEQIIVGRDADDPRGVNEKVLIDMCIPNPVAFQIHYARLGLFEEIRNDAEFKEAVRDFGALQLKRRQEVQEIIQELQDSNGQQFTKLKVYYDSNSLTTLLEGAALDQLGQLVGLCPSEFSKVTSFVNKKLECGAVLRAELGKLLGEVGSGKSSARLQGHIERQTVDVLLSVASEEEEQKILPHLSENYRKEIQGVARLLRHSNGGQPWSTRGARDQVSHNNASSINESGVGGTYQDATQSMTTSFSTPTGRLSSSTDGSEGDGDSDQGQDQKTFVPPIALRERGSSCGSDDNKRALGLDSVSDFAPTILPVK